MNKKIYYYITLLLILVSIGACQTTAKKELQTNLWPISSYNFGGMEDMSVEEQVALLRKSGYQGITLRVAKGYNFKMLPEFITEADKYDDFNINAVFIRYNFDDPTELRESWTDVVDQIAGRNIQLWVIFGKPVEGYDDVFVEKKQRHISRWMQ